MRFALVFLLAAFATAARAAPSLDSLLEDAMSSQNLQDLEMRTGIHVGEVTVVYRSTEETLDCDGGYAYVYVDGVLAGDAWASPPSAGSFSFGTGLADPTKPNPGENGELSTLTLALVTKMGSVAAMGVTKIPFIPGYRITTLLGFSPASFGELSQVMDLPESDMVMEEDPLLPKPIKLPSIEETSKILQDAAKLVKLAHDPGFTHPICGSVGRAPRQRNGEADAPYRVDGEFGLSRTAGCCKRNLRPKPAALRSASSSTIISKLATKHQRAMRVWCTAYADTTFHPFYNNCTGLFRGAGKGSSASLEAVGGQGSSSIATANATSTAAAAAAVASKTEEQVSNDPSSSSTTTTSSSSSNFMWQPISPATWAAVPVEPSVVFGTCAVVLSSQELADRKLSAAIDSQYAVFRVGTDNLRENKTAVAAPPPQANPTPAPPKAAPTGFARFAKPAPTPAPASSLEASHLPPPSPIVAPAKDIGEGIKDTVRVMGVQESLKLCQNLGNFTGPKYIALWEVDFLGSTNAALSCLRETCTSCEWVGVINPQMIKLIRAVNEAVSGEKEESYVPTIGEVVAALASFMCSTTTLFGFFPSMEVAKGGLMEVLKLAEVCSVRL